eukprot:4697550-Amphidinium_carterae.1
MNQNHQCGSISDDCSLHFCENSKLKGKVKYGNLVMQRRFMGVSVSKQPAKYVWDGVSPPRQQNNPLSCEAPFPTIPK